MIKNYLKNYTKFKSFTRKFFTTNNNTIDTDKRLINFHFVYLNDKSEVKVEAEEGKNLLEIAHQYQIDLEGACDMSLACSTCHVILEEDLYEKAEPPVEEEEDLLDLAFGLTATSRLGCQVKVTPNFENRKVYIPAATRNLYVDGYKPKPH